MNHASYVSATGKPGEAGFTLAELAIGIFLTSIVASLVLTAYLFAARQATSWQHAVRAENTVHLVVQRLSRDLFGADAVASAGTQTWVLHQADGQSIRYTAKEGQLWRNEKALLPPEVTTVGFALRPILEDPDQKAAPAKQEAATSSWLTAPPAQPTSTFPQGVAIEIHLTVATGTRQWTTATRIQPRYRTWDPPA